MKLALMRHQIRRRLADRNAIHHQAKVLRA
jgi:hypothetical protein